MRNNVYQNPPLSNWSSYIKDCFSRGVPEEVLAFYKQIRRNQYFLLGVVPLISKACASLPSIHFGKALHAESIKAGVEFDVVVATSLVHMYGNCGYMIDARKLIDIMPKRNVATWNAVRNKNPPRQTPYPQTNARFKNQNQPLPPNPSNWSSHIKECFSRGAPGEALVMYTQVRRNHSFFLGVVPLILKACASLASIRYGKALHAESIKAGVELDVVVGTSLVDMYGNCGDMADACKLFDIMPERNVVTWNAMIGKYMNNGVTESAIELFDRMPERTHVSWIEMIQGFSRCGDTVSARYYFDQVPEGLRNVVTWTVMVDGYSSNGEMEKAERLFEEMPQRNYYVWSSMISGYFKKGNVQEAKATFDRIPDRNLVNWNSLISGYAQNGICEEALDAFVKLQADGFQPDEVTFASVLSACAQLGLLEAGKYLHKMIVHRGLDHNQFILNGLVDMYAKCGDLENATIVFEGMLRKNESCWNAMISGFSAHGRCDEAIEFFGRMEKSGKKPDEITFLSLLSACAHAGFVQCGLEIFSKMEKYGLSANIKHYGCLVDLLGRAGRLKDAYNLISEMPMKPNDTIWGSLLGACRIHSDVDIANKVLENVERDDGGDGSQYVQLSNIYSSSERWEMAEWIKTVISSKGLQKRAGRSSVMP